MIKERILDIEESAEKKDREALKNNIAIKNVECKEEGLIQQHLEQVLESHIGVKLENALTIRKKGKNSIESDRESSISSPEPASVMGVDGDSDYYKPQKMIQHCTDSSPKDPRISSPISATAHLNGAIAGLVSFQNFQNLASLQQTLPPATSLPNDLQHMSSATSPIANAPLNLSVNATAVNGSKHLPIGNADVASSNVCNRTIRVCTHASPCCLILRLSLQESDRESSISSPEPASVMGVDGDSDYYKPQKMIQHCTDSSPKDPRISSPISATAHLNGATSMEQAFTYRPCASSNVCNRTYEFATATCITSACTMPQFILASGQLVQGIQGAQLLIPTSQGLATQTILTIPVNHVNSSDQMVNLALSNGQVVTTSLANLQTMAQTNLLNQTNSAVPTTNGNITPNLLNPSALSHLFANNSSQQFLQTLPQLLTNSHTTNPPPLLNPLAQSVPNLLTTPSTLLTTPPTQSSTQSVHRNLMNQINQNQYDTKMHPTNLPRGSSPPSSTNCISRAPASNGDLSVTSHGSNSSQSLKRSPSSLSLSPNCNDNSTADLLVDSPNQPTINQTNSNVVDGINLDEIKEFAKAFKLRRLSLGLTQTQVGQALSVTEGPAYSQSAICSALASQMIAAAQLSSQQQAMFEKLDITPKSAQKIKPVLERWMKEAEESFYSRYKSGQNHLTDFIGVEPSKKRKRRTSFTPQALELLNAHFERNTHPSGTEITGLAHQLGYEREVIRIWFCNKRQALKNTVRMMSKGMV
ncbi:hypothetical protein FQR65_LT10239 [Abscondita terminalis]|nr:hypothetical protein FQR65_LT10239 [Abscondita terminalis]